MAISIRDLTDEEINFLSTHRIDLADLYDGRNEPTRAWWNSAKNAACDFVLTSTRSCRGSHRLKTRSGHCPQCKTLHISFIRRERAVLNVYLAVAQKGKVIKIGSADWVYGREDSLRKEGYGGYKDWEIVCSVKMENAGKIEREIAKIFSGNELRNDYVKNGSVVTATEMFRFNELDAFRAFKEYVKLELGADLSVKSPRFQ